MQLTEEVKNSILVSAIRSVKIVSLISVVLSIVSLIAGIGLDWPRKEILIIGTVVFLSTALLVVAESLAKRKKWAWYAGVCFFAAGFISSPFIHPFFRLFTGAISGLILFGLFYCRKNYFQQEPKEPQPVSRVFSKTWIIVIALAAVAGGIFAWQYFGLHKETPSQPSEQTAQNKTANWQTYTNEEYGFEIKYPKDWNYGPNILKESPNMVFCPPELSDLQTGCKDKPNIPHMPSSLAPIYLSIDKKPGGTFTIDDFTMLNCERVEKKEISATLMVISYCGERGQEAIWYGPGNTYVFRLFLTDNSFSIIFNQMLSTFRFLE